MEEFRVIQPSPALAPYVKNYWLLKTDGDSDVARTVPTGMMNLIFHRGRRLLSVHENALHPRAFLSGQELTFADLQYDGQVDIGRHHRLQLGCKIACYHGFLFWTNLRLKNKSGKTSSGFLWSSSKDDYLYIRMHGNANECAKHYPYE